MPDSGSLADAYVTILPDMSKFVEELAQKLQEAVNSQHPKVVVDVDANLVPFETKLTEAEAEGQSFAGQTFNANLGADLSDLIGGLSAAKATVDKFAAEDVRKQLILEADASMLGTGPKLGNAKATQAILDMFGNAIKVPVEADPANLAQSLSAADAAGQVIADNLPPIELKLDLNQAYLNAQIAAAKTKIAAASLIGASKMKDFGGLTPTAAALIASSGTKIAAQNQISQAGIPLVLPGGAGGGGGGGGGTLAAMFPGMFGDGTGKGGSGTLAQSLLWGKSGVPFLGALAGMGTLGSLAGFGPEHAITTGIGLAGSAVGGAIGGGLLGAGMLATTGVGFATDLAGTGQAAGDAKKVYAAQQSLGTAQTSYGAQSQQALTAQLALNAALQNFSPVARTAVSQVGVLANTIHQLFNQATGQAEKMGAQIIQSFEKVAMQYIPTIGKFATINTGIIQQALKPLEKWLSGSGLGIFSGIEQIFTNRLPTAMRGFTQGIELVIKSLGYLSQYGGGLMTVIANKLTYLNSGAGFSKLEGHFANLIHDFEVWKGFVEILVKDIAAIFRLDAGLGTGIILSLTHMLDKLHAYIQSSRGQTAIRSIFTAHKQQIIDLLGLIPPLVSAFAPILHIMPFITELTLPFISALVQLLNIIERLPFGIGAVVTGLLGFSLLLGHVIGYGKAFGQIGTIFTTMVPAIGSASAALFGFDGVAAGATLAAKALQIALAVGVLAALVGIGYGLAQIFIHAGPVIGVLATLTVVVGGLALAMSKGLGISTIIGAFTKLWGASTATAVKLSADTEAIIAGQIAQTDAVVSALATQSDAIRGEAVTYSGAVQEMIAFNAELIASFGEVAVAAESMAADVAASDAVAAGGAAVSGAATAGGLSIATLAGASSLGALAAAAAPVALVVGGVAAATWGVDSAINALFGAPDPFANLAKSAGKLGSETVPQMKKSISGLQSQLLSALKNPNNDTMGFFDSLAPKPGETWNQDFQRIVSSPKLLLELKSQASDQGYTNLTAGVTKLTAMQGQVKTAGNNLQWLADHFHITTDQAGQLADQLGINLTSRMNAGGPGVYKFGAALQQMGLSSSGTAQAMSTLSKNSGQTLAQLTSETTQAATAMQQTMATFTSLTGGIANVGQALVQGTGAQVTQFYTQQTTNAAAFSTGILKALSLGFSPAVVGPIMTAGPAQGMQALTGILDGAARQTNGSFVAMTNKSSNMMDLQSASAVELAKMMRVLTGDSSSMQMQIQGNMSSAMAIYQNQMSNGMKGVSASFVNSFKGGAAGLTTVAQQFGMVLPNVITSTGAVSLAAYQKQLAQYAKDTRTAAGNMTGAAVAGLGQPVAAGVTASVPGTAAAAGKHVKAVSNIVGGAAVGLLSAGKLGGQNLANGIGGSSSLSGVAAGQHVTAASHIVGGAAVGFLTSGKLVGQNFANGVGGTSTQSGTAGKRHVDAVTGAVTAGTGPALAAAKALGQALTKGAISGVTADQGQLNSTVLRLMKTGIESAVPGVGGQSLGKALADGATAGIHDSQGEISGAALSVMKGAINSARGSVGGQSLGVALDQGIAAGISSSAGVVAAAASAVVKAASAAASATAGHKSPAKMFIPLGEAISAGIALGIKNNAHMAATAASDAVKGASAAINAQKMTGIQFGSASPQSIQAAMAGGPSSDGQTIHYNPQYTITGSPDANTKREIQLMFAQHDAQLLQKIRAR